MASSVLELNGITKRFGNINALQDINLHVKQGELCALIGENGAGKSTLIKIVVGLSNKTSGSIRLFGEDRPQELKKTRMRIGYMPDSSGAWQLLSARENMRARCAEWGLPENNIDGILMLVGLADTGNKPVHFFSYGMKRRLDLAVALLGNPDFLILDEPINGLDPLGIIEMRELLLRLNREYGKTRLLSSHNLGEIQKTATDYAFIHCGNLLQKLTAVQFENISKKSFVLRVSDAEKAAGVISGLSKAVVGEVVQHDEVALSGYESETLDLISCLSSNGIQIKEMYWRKRSLEEYYQMLMRGGEQIEKKYTM